MPQTPLGDLPETVRYAGFWRRAVAFLLDALCVGILKILLSAPLLSLIYLESQLPFSESGVERLYTFFLSSLGFLLIHFLYFTLQYLSRHQATLGMRALGIKIVDDRHGGVLSFGQATGRYLLSWFSGIMLGIGYLMIAFTRRKQALHDLLANTYVIRA